VVSDLVMPGIDGLALTRRLRETHTTLPIIIVTARGMEGDAERVFEAGATDFVTKPIDTAALVTRLRRSLEDVPAQEILTEAKRKQFDPHGIIGSHPRITELRRFVDNVAAVPQVSALLLGESGTGKNLVARAIHAASPQADFRFVEINCAALPTHLLEAELFGYEKGAFTDARQAKRGLAEEADGGTLFLDEIGALPLELQAKLLTFLESRTFRRIGATREIRVQLRIIAATNIDLAADAASGRFREDLFYRLNVASTVLPPLRAIRSDVPALAAHFVQRAAEYFRRAAPALDDAGNQRLMDHDWPGNARELRNIIERALIFSRGPTLHIEDLGTAGRHDNDNDAHGGSPSEALRIPRGLTLEQLERLYIEATLDQLDGNVQAAADQLGVTRKVLWARRRKLGLLGSEE
jgi:two-component system, NtrC family, response regulator AtoC